MREMGFAAHGAWGRSSPVRGWLGPGYEGSVVPRIDVYVNSLTCGGKRREIVVEGAFGGGYEWY